LLSELVTLLKKTGAKYTILYASQPFGLLENPSNLPLGRYLAEKTNTTKPGRGKCDGECLVKSTLLEGSFVVSCLMDSYVFVYLSFCQRELKPVHIKQKR
jgi:hypothetical protein